MKKFIVLNEAFVCQKCNTKNTPLIGSCRNHCKNCLYSLHLDDNSPGDRLSQCHGLMQPISLNQTGKKGFIIQHQCLKCKKTIPNKVANDDNFEEIIKLSQL